MNDISVCIITKNEEYKIEECLRSVEFAYEIIIVDSGSKDRTIQICQRYNCKIYTHAWEGYSVQKTYAIDKATKSWILSIDADERVSEELKREIENLPQNIAANGFMFQRKNYFLGKLIRHGGDWWYPNFVLRLFKKGKGKFTKVLVHEELKIDGRVDSLQGSLIHYSYDSIADYFSKMKHQTVLQAEQGKIRFQPLVILLKPIYRFFQMFIINKGYLDGFYGLFLAVFAGIYELMVQYQILKRFFKSKDISTI